MSDQLEKNVEGTTGSPAESIHEGTLRNADKAYNFAKEHQTGPLSAEENRAILKRIDRHLLPLVSLNSFLGKIWGFPVDKVTNAFPPDDHYLHAQFYGQECPVVLSKFWSHR